MKPLLSLFRIRPKSESLTEEQLSDNIQTHVIESCRNKVQWVAEAFGADLSEFRVRAAAAAVELGPTLIEHLATQFHSEHTPPAELSQAFSRLGAWIVARQFAIFEILYYFGSDSLPVLKRIAFGEYDWTQGNAIEVLCRLAADGVDRQKIVGELIEQLPSLREEAHYYALGALLTQSETNLALGEIVAQLLVVPEFKQSYELVNESRRTT